MTAEAGGDGPRPRRRLRRAMVASGAVAAGVAVAFAAERAAVRRARSRPDRGRDERLDERPGIERWVVSFDGTRLSARVVGPPGAPSLVFVHGFTQDMTAWHYQWRHFSNRYRCILYDQRGHGRSERPGTHDYSLRALGRDLKAVLEAEAGDGAAALVGHSMGGMAILAFAELFPEQYGPRIRGVVLAGTTAGEVVREVLGGLVARFGRLYLPSPRVVGGNLRRLGSLRARAFAGRGDLAWLVARLTNFGPGAPPSLVDHVVSVAGRTPVDVWADLAGGILEMDLGHALAHVTVPALVVVGDVDRLTPPPTARAIAGRLPDGRLAVMEGAGHLAMMERPEGWNELVGAFLDDVLQRSPAAHPANRARKGRRVGA